MTGDALEFRRVRLSLDAIPERDRLGVYREVIGRQMVRWDLAPAAGAPLTADLEWTALPGLEIIWGAVGATEIRRTPEMIADGNDGFSFSIAMGGRWRMATRGREIDDTGGAAALMSLAEPSLVISPEQAGFLVLQIPRSALAGRVGDIDDAILRPIAPNSAALALLRGYLTLIRQQNDLPDPALRHSLSSHIHDLVALTLGGTPAVAAAGLAASRLRSIKADILANLGRLDLSVSLIAASHRISPRQIHRLFEPSGQSFSAFVLERRLAMAHDRLSERCNFQSVAAVAFDCGFGDVSHFNRAFRRVYGATPSDVRATAAAARRQAQPFERRD